MRPYFGILMNPSLQHHQLPPEQRPTYPFKEARAPYSTLPYSRQLYPTLLQHTTYSVYSMVFFGYLQKLGLHFGCPYSKSPTMLRSMLGPLILETAISSLQGSRERIRWRPSTTSSPTASRLCGSRRCSRARCRSRSQASLGSGQHVYMQKA